MALLLSERSEGYDSSFTQDIEDYVSAELQKSREWAGEIEMVLGLSGVASYAARRLNNKQGIKLCSVIVNLFSSLAVYEGEVGCSWPVPASSVYRFNKSQLDAVEYNLGLAHGVPAVIAALMAMATHSEDGHKAKRMVSDGCNWLIQQRLAESNREVSIFSNCSGHKHPSRLGWCYGDLSIALTLAELGHCCRDRI